MYIGTNKIFTVLLLCIVYVYIANSMIFIDMIIIDIMIIIDLMIIIDIMIIIDLMIIIDRGMMSLGGGTGGLSRSLSSGSTPMSSKPAGRTSSLSSAIGR